MKTSLDRLRGEAQGPAPWIANAARLPIAFAQVREDANIDRWVAEQLSNDAEIVLVASGGCTAAALAALPNVSRLHLVDPNPAQAGLCRFKLRLLATANAFERLRILGHAPMPVAERQQRLETELHALKLASDVLGPIDLVAQEGPDHAGRYEALFFQLREALSEFSGELTALLLLRDPLEQARRADPRTPLGNALDAAFDSVMSLPNLVGLFGEAATRNRRDPFARHFVRRTRHALATLPAANNPYLWQMLRGSFPEGVVYPWLRAAAPARLPEVTWTIASMAHVLPNFSNTCDLLHLSNILDWLTPEECRDILDQSWKALRPGGWMLIRQLNSSLDIPSLGERFDWQSRRADALHHRDRSFFYRKLHLGRKR